ncbi:MAG: DUF4266 domain-containing protein [SAR324 cluster bacterium]|nr:DUF4266 domain-containing protein [SAR324 cluster bacterium]
MDKKRCTYLTALVCLILFAGGCRNVTPIQRQFHAHRFMALSPDPVRESFEEKVFESREAAAGGRGESAGGGCGCN